MEERDSMVRPLASDDNGATPASLHRGARDAISAMAMHLFRRFAASTANGLRRPPDNHCRQPQRFPDLSRFPLDAADALFGTIAR
jgi:hypothetical protein